MGVAHGHPRSADLPWLQTAYEYHNPLPGRSIPPCVVTDSDADWHHLDDDDKNNTKWNFVPLGAFLNRQLGSIKVQIDARRLPWEHVRWRIDPRLQPSALQSRAQSLFINRQPGRAIGCCRLAVYIATNYLRLAQRHTVELICDIMRYLRYHCAEEWLAATLDLNLIPEIKGRSDLPASLRSRVIDELCTLFVDRGEGRLVRGYLERLLLARRGKASSSELSRLCRLVGYARQADGDLKLAKRAFDESRDAASDNQLAEVACIEADSFVAQLEGKSRHSEIITGDMIDKLFKLHQVKNQAIGLGAVTIAHEVAMITNYYASILARLPNWRRLSGYDVKLISHAIRSVRNTGGILTTRNRSALSGGPFSILLDMKVDTGIAYESLRGLLAAPLSLNTRELAFKALRYSEAVRPI